jgi:hypothetical protein
MSRVQIAVYVAVLVLAYCEEEQIPVLALFWTTVTKFWYGLAEFAGTMGIKAESHYHREVSHG